MARLPSWEEKKENLSQSSYSKLGVVQVTQKGKVGFQEEPVLINAPGELFPPPLTTKCNMDDFPDSEDQGYF